MKSGRWRKKAQEGDVNTVIMYKTSHNMSAPLSKEAGFEAVCVVGTSEVDLVHKV